LSENQIINMNQDKSKERRTIKKIIKNKHLGEKEHGS
jgi:hypothetical protein